MDDSKREISLSFCTIDKVQDLTAAKQSPIPQDLNMVIGIGEGMPCISNFSMELSKDEKKLCIMIEGGTGAQYFCPITGAESPLFRILSPCLRCPTRVPDRY